MIGFLLAFWIIHSTPSAASFVYVDETPNYISKPYCDPVLHVTQDAGDCFYQVPKKPVMAPHSGFNSCSCVSYARFKSGLNIKTVNGLAKSIPINSKTPAASGLVVTYESSAGHIALYTLKDNILILDESNYSTCKVTSGRELPVSSALIKGYIN